MSRPSHPWDFSKFQSMKIEDDVTSVDMAPVISVSEAERFVESLKKFDLEEVGSRHWMEQHRRIEKLNLQAHQSAMTNTDEFVIEAILTFSKIDVLIHDLLIIELWKEHVFPLLVDRLAGRNTMRTYFILYHEATVVNLLEVLLYHKHICETAGERLLELSDYSARKMTRLNSGYDFRQVDPDSKPRTASEFSEVLMKRTPKEELIQYFTEIEFKVCISAVTVARFLCEHGDVVPISVVSRITDTHDFLIMLVPLIENPPWTRRLSSGKWQKLVDNAWKEVKPVDLLKVTKTEGQSWIALYYLIAKQAFRERYYLNTFRKGQLLRLRKYLNEILLDQLPFLADIQRYMDELAVLEVPEPSSLGSGVFLLQQVSVLRETLMKGKDWPTIADTQMTSVFVMTDRDDPDLRLLADLYSDDLAENVLDPQSSE